MSGDYEPSAYTKYVYPQKGHKNMFYLFKRVVLYAFEQNIQVKTDGFYSTCLLDGRFEYSIN